MYYVIQVQTSKEEKTIQEIKRHFTNDVLIDVFTPLYTQRKKIKGVWTDVVKPAFPGYIFIETENIKEVFYQLYYVEGFTKLLGRESNSENFLPLNKFESRMIDALYGKRSNHILGISEINIEEGNRVKIIKGQLFGLEAYIKKINFHKRQAVLTFPFGGKSISAVVGIDFVQKMDF